MVDAIHPQANCIFCAARAGPNDTPNLDSILDAETGKPLVCDLLSTLGDYVRLSVKGKCPPSKLPC